MNVTFHMEVFLRSFMNIFGCQKCPQDGSPKPQCAGSLPKTAVKSRVARGVLGRPRELSCMFILVTGEETWIRHWDPETKHESMRWKHPGSTLPKNFKTQPPAGKVMAIVFWDSKCVLIVDYIPAGISITGA